MRNTLLSAAVSGLVVAAAGSSGAQALAITTTTDAGALTSSLLAPNSGLTITGRSLIGAAQQQGTFSGFNLAPGSGSGPTLTLGNGAVFTTGTANLPMTNTANQFNPYQPGTGGYAPLTALSGSTTYDANVLALTFTAAATVNAVSAQFVFGTDEFPTQTVTDIFGFFVDGVNYAKFPNGQLISNTPNNPTNFISNPVGGNRYGIEYNGLTSVFTVTGLFDTQRTSHTLQIAIADTSDRIFDSGVFLSNLTGTNTVGGGGIDPGTPVPEPASMGLFGMGLLGLLAARRRRAA